MKKYRLENCKDCDHIISKSAQSCPGCGARIVRWSPITKAFVWLFAILMGFGFLAALPVAVSDQANKPINMADFSTLEVKDTPDPMEYSSAATSYCQMAIKEQLKAPSTADFHWDTKVAPGEDGTILVAGTVDAQNSFGAMLQNRYVCFMKCQSSAQCETISAGIVG